MKQFHAMFHGTDVYINGKYKCSSNEILTAYLNLDWDTEKLTELLFQMKASLRDIKLHPDFSEEERFEDYDKNVWYAQRLIDQIDAVWPTLPPYNNLVDRYRMQKNNLRVCLNHFTYLLEGDQVANILTDYQGEDDDDRAYISARQKFVPISMDWYWTNGTSQHTIELQRSIDELNEAIENLMQPYIHWIEDVLRIKCCYQKLLDEFVHIKHGFLAEADLAKQFAAYFKTESLAAMPHRKLNGPAPLSSGHEVFTPQGGTPFLCASYDFDRLGAFLYEDFFRGLAEHFLPKRCSNCGKWFLIDAGIYSDYCEKPLPEDPTKTCRMVSARKKYDTKCKEDPIWNIYNKAYKTHYARVLKKKMSKTEFEAWSRYAVELREQAERKEIAFDAYVQEIKK